MATKHDTEVLIGGKVFTISSYESEEYLQRIAAYINGKISEYSKIDSYSRQSLDVQSILLQLNIADDYFKIRMKYEELKDASEAKDKELYDVKHDLVTSQLKLKSLEESFQKLRDENNENQKKIVKLETELNYTDEDFAYDEEDDVSMAEEGAGDKGLKSGASRKTGRKRNRR